MEIPKIICKQNIRCHVSGWEDEILNECQLFLNLVIYFIQFKPNLTVSSGNAKRSNNTWCNESKGFLGIQIGKII